MKYIGGKLIVMAVHSAYSHIHRYTSPPEAVWESCLLPQIRVMCGGAHNDHRSASSRAGARHANPG